MVTMQVVQSAFNISNVKQKHHKKLTVDDFFNDPIFIEYCDNMTEDDIAEGTLDDLFEEVLGPYDPQKK